MYENNMTGQRNISGLFYNMGDNSAQHECNGIRPKECDGLVNMEGTIDKTHKSKTRKVKRGKDTNNKDRALENNLIDNNARGGKRDVHPTTSGNSRKNRILKRRKNNGDEDSDKVNNMDRIMSGAKDVEFQEANKDSVFTEGMDDGVRNSNKKSGQKNIKKANKNGRNETVSWAKAESKNAKDVEAVEKDPEKGIGKAGKKGWIKSIIKNEQPDIIDLNVVRGHDERMNSQINIKETGDFNDFIDKAKFIEIPKGEEDTQEREGYIGHVVEEAWKVEGRSRRPDCRFCDKLKNVKVALKKWSKERFKTVNEKIERLKNEAMKWEMEVEKRTSSESEREVWMEARKSWMDKENNLKCML
ncbi:hypothetical protein Tco_0308882 [Tanacetum coccineum]